MAVSGVVPVAAIVPVFQAGTYRHYRGTTTVPSTWVRVRRPRMLQASRQGYFLAR